MALKFPESFVHHPTTPVPETKGKSRWHENLLLRIGLGLATIGTGAALAHQMFTGADKGPSAPPVDNGAASDTFKPPEGGSNVSLVPISPSSAEAAPSTSSDSGPSTPPKPPESPMDQALQAGKIDLTAGNKVEDYFKPVSKSEAQTNNTPDFPVNPQKNPNLEVGNDVIVGTQGTSFRVLYLDNVENDQVFKATETGTFRIDNAGSPPDNYKLARIEIGGRRGSGAAYLIYIKGANIPAKFVWGEKYEVNAGDTLFSIVKKDLPLPDRYNNHQIVILMQGANNSDSPLTNFVGSDGKIPFIDDSSLEQ